MLSALAVPVSTYTIHELLDYLRDHASTQDVDDAIETAIRYWLAEMQQRAHMPARQPLRGYQWKSLFLPEGTQIRVFYQADCAYAQVIGEKIIFNGESVSPNRLANMDGGGVRNAWRDLSIRFPGEKNWRKAFVLRREGKQLEKKESPAPVVELVTQPTASPAAASPGAAAFDWPHPERRRMRFEDIGLD